MLWKRVLETMINYEQLVEELAAQFYINKDRVTVGWNAPDPAADPAQIKDYPDPDRQWYDYRDEWLALNEQEKQVWIDKATTWLRDWQLQYPNLYPLLFEHGKAVYSAV